MAKFRIRPSSLKGSIFIPPSKSHTLRAILFAALAHGSSEILSPLNSLDTTAMIQAMRQFGCKIEQSTERIRVEGLRGKLLTAENVIDAGNSGLVLRLVGALAGLSPAYTILTGDHSIRHKRPVQPLLNALEQLGAFAVSARNDQHAPIIVRGPIHPGYARFSGEDSQPVSGMLIAASCLPGKSIFEVENTKEKPWIDLTLHWLKKYGIHIEHENHQRYSIPGNARFDGFSFLVPGDLSSAAFAIAAALITGSELTVGNIDTTDCQGDKKLIYLLQEMGADITIDPQKKTLIVGKQSQLRGIKINIDDCVDALPILSVVGCFAEGITEITNASGARHKESDRVRAIASELRKMGAQIEENPEGLRIAQSPLKGTLVTSWHDHRIAMALSVAALAAKGETLVEGTEWIAKTYPDFCPHFCALGANVESIL
jgi:3-phosphoshikimate 1-carboxyvinyltransferase